MNMFEPQVPATLSNICGGEVEKQFQREAKHLLSQLCEGEKGTITISLGFERTKGSAQMINIKSSVKVAPPAKVRQTIGQITPEFTLQVDKPAEEKVVQLSIAREGTTGKE